VQEDAPSCVDAEDVSMHAARLRMVGLEMRDLPDSYQATNRAQVPGITNSIARVTGYALNAWMHVT
jgi:hypothetical protein